MRFIIDGSMGQLGITEVVYAVARGLDPAAEIPEDVEREIREMGDAVVRGRYDSIYTDDVTEGYRDLIKKAGRSVKKNPPTVPGFLDNIKHRGSMPRINSIVDVYNLESIRSSLAIGGHDLDSVHGDVTVTVCGREDSFTAIGGKEKHVEPADFVYRDENGIMAWLDVRDSEFYKMSDRTANVLFVMQGNAATSADYRVEAMKRLERDLRKVHPGMTFEIRTASIGKERP
ncbi:MAG: hypothetical protein IKE37_00795 [Firmicutes bacterium]|nr:hypothetical protein [Bacillota bacterium]